MNITKQGLVSEQSNLHRSKNQVGKSDSECKALGSVTEQRDPGVGVESSPRSDDTSRSW